MPPTDRPTLLRRVLWHWLRIVLVFECVILAAAIYVGLDDGVAFYRNAKLLNFTIGYMAVVPFAAAPMAYAGVVMDEDKFGSR